MWNEFDLALGREGHDLVFLTEVLKLTHTQRFNRETTHKPQSVAEHSFGVAMFAWILSAYIQKKNPELEVDVRYIVLRALLHDFAEGQTGDLDYRVKHLNGRSKSLWDDIERLALEKFVERTEDLSDVIERHLPDPIGSNDPFAGQEPDWVEDVIKLADYLEFCWYCYRELKLGNKLAFEWLVTGSDIVQSIAEKPTIVSLGLIDRSDGPLIVLSGFFRSVIRRERE